MHSTVVVLPAPLAPIKPTILPAGTSRSRPSTTTLSPYALRRPRTLTTSFMPPMLPATGRRDIGPGVEPGLYPRGEAAWGAARRPKNEPSPSWVPEQYPFPSCAMLDAQGPAAD